MESEGLKLYSYQRQDVDRSKEMSHVLLFSEMGTGKTPTAIKMVEEENLKPCLVLCPPSLKLNWWEEIDKWAEEGVLCAESADDITRWYFDEYNLEPRDVYYVLQHEALAYISGDPIREMLYRIKWKSIIIDEAHRLRNLEAKRTQGMLKLGRSSTKFIFLTGTPIVNSSFDIFPILKKVGVVQNPSDFLREYSNVRSTRWGNKVIGSKNTEDLLVKLAPIYIRRTKSEVLSELPAKTVQVIKLDMPSDQRTTYDHFVTMLCLELEDGEKLYAPNILTLLTRLRQLNLDPEILGKVTKNSKTPAIIDLIKQAPKDKWVVCSTSKQYINRLADTLPGRLGCKCVLYTGDQKPSERAISERRFKLNLDVKVMLMTMQTGGLGLNLQVASNIILTDLWWNYAAMDQAIDRLHRVGQTKPVTAYILENNDSVDQAIREACEAKGDQANDVVVAQEVIRSIYKKKRGVELSEW